MQISLTPGLVSFWPFTVAMAELRSIGSPAAMGTAGTAAIGTTGTALCPRRLLSEVLGLDVGVGVTGVWRGIRCFNWRSSLSESE